MNDNMVLAVLQTLSLMEKEPRWRQVKLKQTNSHEINEFIFKI